jgi:hypothetical protein
LIAVATSTAVFGSDSSVEAPYVTITVDGVSYDGPRLEIGTDRTGKPLYRIEDFKLETPEFRLDMSGELNPDPSIGYAIGVTDFGAPSVFGFVFFTPIVPTGFPNTVDSSLTGGLIDFGGDGISLTPTAATLQTSSVGMPLTGMGVDLGPAFAAGPSSPGAPYVYGPFTQGPIPGPGPGPWTGLQVSVGFGLSGGSDSAALTGFAQILEGGIVIPETGANGSMALLAGLVGGCYWRRRQSQKA